MLASKEIITAENTIDPGTNEIRPVNLKIPFDSTMNLTAINAIKKLIRLLLINTQVIVELFEPLKNDKEITLTTENSIPEVNFI
ncbi:hypothetical protein [Pseudomethylobacillus aquaticus]|uniref:hypothetical protein n=1 Tax=Pseudomethylobacillus aquaticus TaxID=2676064 RepID=UPI0011CD365B|nr:hypothetical protein [Pseudomethylobacillus aquaticus]